MQTTGLAARHLCCVGCASPGVYIPGVLGDRKPPRPELVTPAGCASGKVAVCDDRMTGLKLGCVLLQLMTTSFDGSVVRWERERDDEEDVPVSSAAGGKRFRRKRGSRRLTAPDRDGFMDSY